MGELRTRTYKAEGSPSYDIHIVRDTPGIDLKSPGAKVVFCMGVMQAEDIKKQTVEEARARLESGEMPYSRKFFAGLNHGEDIQPVYAHMGEGLERMCRAYFRYADEIFCQPSLAMPVPPVYLVSFRSMEERMKILMHLKDIDQSTFYTDEAADFVTRNIAPYMGKYTLTKHADGIKIPQITARAPTEEIIRHLEKLVFICNSTGGNFVTEIENVMREMLKTSQFPPKDTEAIMKCMKAVVFGQLTNFKGLKGPRFTGVYFEGINDLVAEFLNPHKLKLTAGQIRKYATPEQQGALIKAAQEHYRHLKGIFKDESRLTGQGESGLGYKPMMIPFRMDDNRVLIATTVPTYRSRWVFNPTAMRANDARTEKQIKHILNAVAEDKMGHHIALSLAQGYPPFYVVPLAQRLLHNMAAVTDLPPKQKDALTVDDLMVSNLAARRIGIDNRGILEHQLLQAPLAEALAKAQQDADKSAAADDARQALRRPAVRPRKPTSRNDPHLPPNNLLAR